MSNMTRRVPSSSSSSHSFTEVSYSKKPNYLERVGDSMCAMVFGFLIFSGSFYLLWWNEGRAVATEQALQEGAQNTIPISFQQVDNQAMGLKNGDLVHLSGVVSTPGLVDKGGLRDKHFHVGAAGVALKRHVEMFQWKERVTETTVDEGDQKRTEKTYDYYKSWESSVLDSESFKHPRKHNNPTHMKFTPNTQRASTVNVGDYTLSKDMVSHLESAVSGIILRFNHKLAKKMSKEKDIEIVDDHMFYTGEPDHPRVGDCRVWFELIAPTADVVDSAKYVTNGQQETTISVIGKLSLPTNVNTAFSPASGTELSMVHQGSMTSKQMFDAALASNNTFTWILRFVGWLVMYIGMAMMTQIIHTLVDWVPIVRTLVSYGVSMVNFVLSFSLSLVTIALAWIRFRPMLATAMLAIAILPTLVIKEKKPVGEPVGVTG